MARRPYHMAVPSLKSHAARVVVKTCNRPPPLGADLLRYCIQLAKWLEDTSMACSLPDFDSYVLEKLVNNARRPLVDDIIDMPEFAALVLQLSQEKKFDILWSFLKFGFDINIGNGVALQAACAYGQAAYVRRFLKLGANIHVEGDAPLRLAVLCMWPAVVTILLEHGADVHALDDCALRWACQDRLALLDAAERVSEDMDDDDSPNLPEMTYKSIKVTNVPRWVVETRDAVFDAEDAVRLTGCVCRAEIVQQLIGAGADVHVRNEEPLFVASRDGFPDVVRLLVGAGVATTYDNNIERALIAACTRGHLTCARVLIEDEPQFTAMERKCQCDCPYRSLCIKKKKPTPVVQPQINVTRACSCGSACCLPNNPPVSVIPCSAPRPGDSNDMQSDDSSCLKIKFSELLLGQPMISAVENGHLPIVRYLLENVPKLRQMLGVSTMYHAISLGHVHILQYLLYAVSRDVWHAKKKALAPAVCTAVKRGHMETFHMMIDKWGDGRGDLIDAILKQSAVCGECRAVGELISMGADIHQNDEEPLRLASRFGHAPSVRMLIRCGADVHALDDEALCSAVAFRHTAAVVILCGAGANVMARDGYPINQSIRLNDSSTLEVLRAYTRGDHGIVKKRKPASDMGLKETIIINERGHEVLIV